MHVKLKFIKYLQCRSKISELRIRIPYSSNTRMRMLSYAYAYVAIRVCPAFVIHCHTFALCGIVLPNKRNGKVNATARSTKFVNDDRTIIEHVTFFGKTYTNDIPLNGLDR